MILGPVHVHYKVPSSSPTPREHLGVLMSLQVLEQSDVVISLFIYLFVFSVEGYSVNHRVTLTVCRDWSVNTE